MQRSSWWDARSNTQQHLVCAAALVAIALYFCWPTLISGEHLIGGDTIHWRSAAASMLEHRQEVGEEPLWATNVFSGMPGLVISPPPPVFQIDRLFARFRLVSWPLSHVLVLLFGAYLLASYLTKDKLLGLLAAASYGLTTYLPIILVAGHNSKFIALAYAPWLLLAFIYALRRPSVLSSLLFAVAVAINLRAGHVQIPYYIAIIGLVWWVVELVGAIRQHTVKQFASSSLWLLMGAALGVVMVTEIYWPTYEYKAFTIRGMASGGGEGALDWAYAMGWSQGPKELATLLFADAYGGSALYWGPKTFTGGPHYVGGIVILLAVLAFWRLRTRTAWALGSAAVLMTLFSLGRHFPLLNRPMFEHFPLFDAFRTPETWLIAVALTLAILAALGLGYVTKREGGHAQEKRKTHAIYLATGIALGITLLLFAASDTLFDFERPGERQRIEAAAAQQAQLPADHAGVIQAADQFLEERLIGPRREAFRADAMRTVLLLLIAAGGLVLFRQGRMPATLLKLLILALVAFDLGGVAKRYFNEDHLSPRSDPAARIQTLDVDQFLLQKKTEAGGPGHFRVLSLESPDQTRNARPSFHHESLGGYSGAKLRLYQDFLEHILTDPATGYPAENALDMMNTRYIIAQGRIPGTREVFLSSPFMVLENPDPLSRAALIGTAEVIGDAEATWARLREPAFDPHRTAIVSAPLAEEIVPLDSNSVADVSMDYYGPREMAFTVTTDAPRLLLISEVYYPAGWKATVSNLPASIYRANYLLRAVPVPEGTHQVVLRFDPTSFVAGRWISVATTLLVYLSILGLGVRAWGLRRRRR